jgi:excisionase family DNA binding protein
MSLALSRRLAEISSNAYTFLHLLGDLMPTGTHEEDVWLSLREASQRIGVSAATLRSWADRGRVPTFRTPGGHRRFRERDLAALAASGQESPAVQTLRVLAHAALGRTRFEVADGWLAKREWYRRFPAGSRDEHRELGRQVILALAELVSGGEGIEGMNARAEQLGRAYGELNRKYDIALTDALNAFLYFRDSFNESLIELAKTSPTLDVLLLMRRTTLFVDAMLLSMVQTYAPSTRRKKRLAHSVMKGRM